MARMSEHNDPISASHAATTGIAANPALDAELMAMCAEGNALAFRRLMGMHLDYTVRFAQRMLGRRQDAEDAAQDAWIKVWRAAPTWRQEAKFRTWMTRILYNTCIDMTRSNVIKFELPSTGAGLPDAADTAPSPEAKMIGDERARVVSRALQDLPDRQRAALILSYYEGLSTSEGAAVLNIAPNAFQQLTHRARQNLRSELAALAPEVKP